MRSSKWVEASARRFAIATFRSSAKRDLRRLVSRFRRARVSIRSTHSHFGFGNRTARCSPIPISRWLTTAPTAPRAKRDAERWRRFRYRIGGLDRSVPMYADDHVRLHRSHGGCRLDGRGQRRCIASPLSIPGGGRAHADTPSRGMTTRPLRVAVINQNSPVTRVHAERRGLFQADRELAFRGRSSKRQMSYSPKIRNPRCSFRSCNRRPRRPGFHRPLASRPTGDGRDDPKC